MSDLLLQDAEDYPDSFDLKRPALRSEIESVEEQLGESLPPSFCDILTQLGQGIFFDNESLLGVHEVEHGHGDLLSINHDLRAKQGLPEYFLVFHLGTGGLHAFDTRTRGPEFEVVALDEDTLAPGQTYAGFDEWYLEVMREEYSNLVDLE